MKFTKRLKIAFSNDAMGDLIKRFLTGADLEGDESGLHVDSDTAMKYSAVYACVKVLAETYASCPLLLYRKNQDGVGRTPATDLPIYDILHNVPNPEMCAMNYDLSTMVNLNLGGNFVAERMVNKAGDLIGLYPYPHTMVTIERDPQTQQLAYRISNGTNTKLLSRQQVLHIPNMSLDGIIGISPITYAANAIRLGISYEQFGVNFYHNAAMPSGAFTSPNTLTDPSYERLKKELKENYTGLRRNGTPLLLEGGLDFKQFTINPADAQLIESKYFQIEDICRIYRVPQHLINDLTHATFSNIEQLSLEFVMYTMLPIFKLTESCINAQLLTQQQRQQGYFFERKIDGLLRGDSAARAALYASGRQWGWLSANDCRRLENLPPIPGGDIYLTPSNMMNSEDLESGKAAAAQASDKILNEIEQMLKERRNAA